MGRRFETRRARNYLAFAATISSRTRAQVIRDYVVGKFKLDPTYVAIMPMGADAPESPTGRDWNGVALAMFVQASALGKRSGAGSQP